MQKVLQHPVTGIREMIDAEPWKKSSDWLLARLCVSFHTLFLQGEYQMADLDKASRELFRRQPDECFPSIPSLWEHCYRQKERSQEAWLPPKLLTPSSVDDSAVLTFAQGGKGIPLRLNDWSFGQLCRFAKVGKETINRLTSETASRVFAETLPKGQKPWQLLIEGNRVRSVHAASYSRLYNADLLSVVREFAV